MGILKYVFSLMGMTQYRGEKYKRENVYLRSGVFEKVRGDRIQGICRNVGLGT